MKNTIIAIMRIPQSNKTSSNASVRVDISKIGVQKNLNYKLTNFFNWVLDLINCVHHISAKYVELWEWKAHKQRYANRVHSHIYYSQIRSGPSTCTLTILHM